MFCEKTYSIQLFLTCLYSELWSTGITGTQRPRERKSILSVLFEKWPHTVIGASAVVGAAILSESVCSSIQTGQAKTLCPAARPRPLRGCGWEENIGNALDHH